MLKLVPTLTYFWTFEDCDGEIYDADFGNRADAELRADEIFVDKCVDQEPRNNEEFEEDFAAIRFYYDDNGERQIVERHKSVLEYTHYRGDRAEHSYP